jgi:hypothetical protein
MIDLEACTAGTKNLPITQWKVVFVLPPFGVFLNLSDAVAKASEAGLDPSMHIIPSAAAMAGDEMELTYR